MLFLKNFLFTILVPGTATVYIPYLILAGEDRSIAWGAQELLALLPLALGLAVYLRCVWAFATVGRGTPAPIDPPRRLVVEGLYRYVRNPMYVGVLLILLGEVVLFGSLPLLVYAALFFLFFHGFTVLYEEPVLRRKFGEPYERYCESVHRWLPGRRYEPGD